jgi:hypothetical protein
VVGASLFSAMAISWCSRSAAISGIGGLGVFVRQGLVIPVSLVRSAVEAILTLLVIDRRRWPPNRMEEV